MLHEITPLKLMAVGFALLVASWLVLLLMVIGEIAPSLLLSMGAYAASVAGLVVGLLGVAHYVRGERSHHEEPDTKRRDRRGFRTGRL